MSPLKYDPPDAGPIAQGVAPDAPVPAVRSGDGVDDIRIGPSLDAVDVQPKPAGLRVATTWCHWPSL